VIPINGHVSITGDGPEQVGEILACQKLPRCVVFVPDRNVAEAILQHGAHAAVQDAVKDDWALVWMSRAQGPVQKLCFDSSGRITGDAVFSLAYWELRVAAGSRIETGEDERSYVIRGHEGSITFGSIPVAEHQIRIGTSGSRDAGQIMFSGECALADAEPSLRYFYPSITGPVAGLKYPMFRTGANSERFVPVDVRIHPTHAADSSRNQVTINSSTGSGSNFLSVAGNSMSLAIIPYRSGIGQQWDPVQQQLYPVPIGDWRLGTGATGLTGATGDIDLMCGLSGLEYAKVADGSIMRFVANSPAYAPHFLTPSKTGGTQSLIAECPGSALPVTTSWIYFGPDGPTGMTQESVLRAATGPTGPQGYYSQPVKGGLFQLDQSDAFLQVLQLQTANFPPGATPVFGAPQASFPMVPYAGVGVTTSTETDLYNRFEVEVLSPTRSNAIFAMNQPATEVTAVGPMGLGSLPGVRTGLTAPAVTGPMAVTPQGMLSTFSPDYSVWLRLIMATTGHGGTLELQNLDLTLRAALLTNQLFLVIANPKILESYCKVLFPELTISGWSFDLSPDSWRADSVLILKFAEKSLEGLINDLSLWSAPGSKLNYGTATQTVLKNSVAEARANADQPEFQYFLETVLKDWNGILFLNLTVPPSDLPPQLRGLAAGIDIQSFKAHHLGVNLSPVQVTNGQIHINDSALFALIYYEDLTDLAFQGDPYDFKVLSLRVLFANSDISSFSSRIELLVGALFGEPSSLEKSDHGDNLILTGVMQKKGSQESYSFTEQGTDTFVMQSKVLETVVITQAQFITLPTQGQSSLVSTRFLLWGSLRFQQLPELDLFSFGREGLTGPMGQLAFSNLIISMDYGSVSPTGPTGASGPTAPPGPQQTSFAFEAGQMVFDLGSSNSRPQSLYSRFPLQVSGMVQGDPKTMPRDLGYIPMDSPITAGSLGDPWFGLQMALSLGSPGSLAAKAGFTATLLAAWAPSQQAYNAAVAIRLPGSEGGSKSLTIEGPLKLAIGDLALLFHKQQEAYLMRFSNIALSFLGVKFPSSGRTNMLLFGDPNPKGANTTLGWYAAYMKNPSKTGPTGPTQPSATPSRALPADCHTEGRE
jgi:hypothetical protein